MLDNLDNFLSKTQYKSPKIPLDSIIVNEKYIYYKLIRLRKRTLRSKITKILKD